MENRYIAAVRLKETGRVFYRASASNRTWADRMDDATRFSKASDAHREIERTPNERYHKKVGTPAQVAAWIEEHEGREKMKKLQDQINATIKKTADFYAAPALFISTDGLGGGVVTSNVKPEGDPVLNLVETYAAEAEKIYEDQSAGPYTWNGLLHAFLADVTEAARK